MGSHVIHNELLQERVSVDIIGAGGTGSQMVNGLARLHIALLALGHPGGLHVTLWDDDAVSEANVGRQAFYPCDVGHHKAPVLITRINLAFGLDWASEISRVNAGSKLGGRIVIGCVDNRAARLAILSAASRCRVNYWLDCGNALHTAQAILGEVDPATSKRRKVSRLPHAADLLPELVNASLDVKDEAPSCSLAEALEKQSLFINSTIALSACSLLADLFRNGQIAHHGTFVNLKSGRSSPMQVSEDAWKRFGYNVKKQKRKQ